MILLEVIWWLFFYISAWGAICLHFPRHAVYVGKPHALWQSKRRREEESKSASVDEARGLLFSLLISLNLLIPILKLATLHCCCLLCVAPSQIKLRFIPVPFKHGGIHRSTFSSAPPPLRYRRPYLLPDALCKRGHLRLLGWTQFRACITITRPFSSGCFKVIRIWQWRYQLHCTGLNPI